MRKITRVRLHLGSIHNRIDPLIMVNSLIQAHLTRSDECLLQPLPLRHHRGAKTEQPENKSTVKSWSLTHCPRRR